MPEARRWHALRRLQDLIERATHRRPGRAAPGSSISSWGEGRRRLWRRTGSPPAMTRSPSAGPRLRSPPASSRSRSSGSYSSSSCRATSVACSPAAATMANFVGLTAARSWFGEKVGVDIDSEGLSGCAAAEDPQQRLRASRARCRRSGCWASDRGGSPVLTSDSVGRLDLGALERELRGAEVPAIVIANAGEVNAGEFDPIDEMAALAKDHDAWLHVDGAFGLFSRLSERTRALTDGIEQADSVTCDGHKWLNVPYDCGFAFVREPERLPHALSVGAPYLPSADDPQPSFGFLSPENSGARGRCRSGRRCGPTGARATGNGRAPPRYRRPPRRADRRGSRAGAAGGGAAQHRLLPGAPGRGAGGATGRAELQSGPADPGRWPRFRRLDHLRRSGRAATGNRQWRTGPADVELLVAIVREITAELAGKGPASGAPAD